MKSTFSKPAALAALALCVVFSIILVNRIAGALSGNAPVPVETVSGLELLPADAPVTGMVEVNRTLDNGVFGIDRDSIFPTDDAKEKVNESLEKFAEYTGINPTTDVDRILFSLTNLENDANPILIVQGQIDSDQLIEFLSEKLGDQLVVSDYNGDAIYAIDKEAQLSVAFPSSNLIVVAHQRAELENVLDRFHGTLPATEFNTERISHLGSSSAWVSVNNIQRYATQMVGMDDTDERLDLARRAIDAVAAGIDTEGDRLVFTSVLTPVESVSSGDLEDILKGLVAAARTAANDHPENPVVADVIDRVKVRKSGDQVIVSLKVDKDDLEQAARSFGPKH